MTRTRHAYPIVTTRPSLNTEKYLVQNIGRKIKTNYFCTIDNKKSRKKSETDSFFEIQWAGSSWRHSERMWRVMKWSSMCTWYIQRLVSETFKWGEKNWFCLCFKSYRTIRYTVSFKRFVYCLVPLFPTTSQGHGPGRLAKDVDLSLSIPPMLTLNDWKFHGLHAARSHVGIIIL